MSSFTGPNPPPITGTKGNLPFTLKEATKGIEGEKIAYNLNNKVLRKIYLLGVMWLR